MSARRFVVGEVSGYRIASDTVTTEIAVHDSWYCYEMVANYPAPLKGPQRLEKRRTLAREQAARMNREVPVEDGEE